MQFTALLYRARLTAVYVLHLPEVPTAGAIPATRIYVYMNTWLTKKHCRLAL